MRTLFDFDDILLTPATITEVSSRKKLQITYDNGYLPLMTAPMDTVVSEDNKYIFQKNKILTVLPRIANPDINYFSTSSVCTYSYSLNDFERIFLSNKQNILTNNKYYVLIDVANGHMRDVLDTSNSAKKYYGDSIYLIIGNIANPDTMFYYGRLKIDAIRCGIGNGNACLTTEQTGVGYPMGSLINELGLIKDKYCFDTKIIADGGMKKYSDIIKALNLGADYVMIGSIFNKALESAGNTFTINEEMEFTVNQYSHETYKEFKDGVKFYKQYRGMSTKEVQKSLGKTKLTTSEGITKTQEVLYTLKDWVENFSDYLKSAMSYLNKTNINDFVGSRDFKHISINALNRFNK